MLLVVFIFFCKERFYSFILQNVLFSVTSCTLTLLKWCFLDSFNRFDQRLHWRLYSDQFSIFLSSFNLFLHLDFFIIGSRRVFVITGWLLFHISFCFKEANWLKMTLNANWNDSKPDTESNCFCSSSSNFYCQSFYSNSKTFF